MTKTLLSQQQIEAVFQKFSGENPMPKTELVYKNPFTLLVAVVLSAQATDKSVNKATAPLFDKADTPEGILALGAAGFSSYIKTIGLYRAKTRYIIALCQELLRRFGGQVPRTREDLESLPGVGRKTANVILNIVFGEPTLAVDTHIFRVARRLGLSDGKTPLEVERHLLERIPAQWHYNAHHWLILHGRYVCKAKAPLCAICKIRPNCSYVIQKEAIAC